MNVKSRRPRGSSSYGRTSRINSNWRQKEKQSAEDRGYLLYFKSNYEFGSVSLSSMKHKSPFLLVLSLGKFCLELTDKFASIP